ncbi:SETMR methyltransferase, partial [Acromyrmex heyeri]
MKDLTPKEIKAELDNVHSTSATMISILHEQLGMKKLSVRWMPRLFTVDHKRSKQCLEMFRRKNFFQMNFCNETWIHYFTPEEGIEEGKDREVGRKGDGHSFLGCTRYNSYRLPSVEANDQWRLPHLVKKKVLFHQDNTRVHTCPAPMAKFNEFRYELLLHPAYSPDLAPCDYFLFPNLKQWSGGKRFTTREQLIAETEAYFEGLESYYMFRTRQ